MIKLLTKKNYLAMIRNTAKGENHMFRNMYGLDEAGEKDLIKDGSLGCGKVVSAILYLNKLIKDLHLTVGSTEKDMKENGWNEISEPKEGAVVVWEPILASDGMSHLHMGFYLNEQESMSNDSNGSGIPIIHHSTFGANPDGSPKRKIIRMYWHPALDES